jgi:hypothetical protein
VGQHVNERDPEKVKQRDAQLMALQAEKQKANGKKQLIAFRVPGFEKGFVARPHEGVRGAGDAFLQGRVRRGDREGKFDDVVGRNFTIVGRNGDPAAALSAGDRDFWASLGGNIVRVGNEAGAVADVDGQCSRLMDEYGCDVIIKRPDFYIFGACRSAKELPALIADLREQLQRQH